MSYHTQTGPVVVGVDGSQASDLALDAAIDLALLEGRPLRVVHAELVPAVVSPALVSGQIDNLPELVRQASKEIVVRARDRVRAAAPDLSVTADVESGDARDVLVSASRSAAWLVVGSRGLGTVSSLLLGSVGVSVTQHAACPTVVVRGRSDYASTILVATDATETSSPALAVAFAQASARAVPVTVLHCFDEGYLGGNGIREIPEDELEAYPDQLLAVAESVAGLREKYPDVEVRIALARGPAADVIVHASARALIVVVGTHQWSTARALLSGSVSRAVTEHARSTVVVVPRD